MSHRGEDGKKEKDRISSSWSLLQAPMFATDIW